MKDSIVDKNCSKENTKNKAVIFESNPKKRARI